ncbi:hypothetical protein A2U01_0057405, partial [Trifolium medium]|nr:hypothetical protein [Trifolium medium]
PHHRSSCCRALCDCVVSRFCFIIRRASASPAAGALQLQPLRLCVAHRCTAGHSESEEAIFSRFTFQIRSKEI